jgi:hypothetical protein
MVEKRTAERDMVRKPEGKRKFVGFRLDGSTILKSILNKENGRLWTGIISMSMGHIGGLLFVR